MIAQRSRRWLANLAIVFGLLFAATPQFANAQTSERCFAETGYCISGRIREFWEQNGGLPVFGFPIAPQGDYVAENGQTIQAQWFERNRLELHPSNPRPYDVLLGRLGADRLAQQGRDWNSFAKGGAVDGCRFFAETGHSVCGEILRAWRASGLEFDGQAGTSEAESLALFGLPLSSPQVEETPSGTYTVQWFERARFEIHPENQPPYNVLLGLLGNEISTTPAAPAQPEQPVGPSDNCADVPDPVSARIRPSKCIAQDEFVIIDVFGFKANEQVGFWINAPDGSILGTIETVNIGPRGAVEGLIFDAEGAPPGIYSIVFEGTASKHQAVAYFKVLP